MENNDNDNKNENQQPNSENSLKYDPPKEINIDA